MSDEIKRMKVSPKAQKRMVEWKKSPKRVINPDSAPYKGQLPYEDEKDLWDKSFGKKSKPVNPKVEE